jgi:tetratricopeptide (TPR) repeat protein
MAKPLSLVAACLVLAWTSAPGEQPLKELGRIDFPTSGSPAAQPAFLRGVLLLHSFEYDDAKTAFVEAQRLDPGFAMAYWGEAMTHNHPVWQQTAPEAARATLARLGPTLDDRLAKAPTAKEKDWIASLEPLFGAGDKLARDRAYADLLERMAARYPDDLEVASFCALAILGTSHGGKDVATYMRAAAIVEDVFAKNPRHPGAAHYLIHSYDDPVHAPLGMRAANAYAAIAPDASHALHMPSHIYFAMGMWNEAAVMNERSWEAAAARVQSRSLGIDDRGFHALLWLEYAYLQQGRYRDAQRMLDIMEADAQASGSVRTRSHLALMRAAWLVETRRWETAKGPVVAAGLGRDAVAADLFAIGLAAARSGNVARGQEVLAAMRAASAQTRPGASGHDGMPGMPMTGLPAAGAGGDGRVGAIMADELEAVLQVAAGRTAEAVALLRKAARAEDALSFEFGPPNPVKPAHELLGEVLLEQKQPADATREFEAALARAPRRALSLMGLAQAAAASGDHAIAERARAELQRVQHRADRNEGRRE